MIKEQYKQQQHHHQRRWRRQIVVNNVAKVYVNNKCLEYSSVWVEKFWNNY